MRRSFARAACLAAILAAALAAGYAVIDARFRTGDVLADYSADLYEPKGAAALRETLEASGRRVQSMTRPLNDHRPDPSTSVVMYLGPHATGEEGFEDDERNAIREYLLAGGRVFIASSFTSFLRDYKTYIRPEREMHRDSAPVAVRGIGPFAALLGGNTIRAPGMRRLDCRWPEADALLAADTLLIAVRMKVGGGELIACAEPYLISNEGLLRNKNSAWPAWITAGRTEVYIDETHHGVYQEQGVAWLIGKYKLWPFLLTLGAIALLGLWRILPPLLPPAAEIADSVRRQDTFLGFVNLLKGVIPERRLIGVCMEKWAQAGDAHSRRLDGVDAGKPEARQVCKTYNDILKKLEERKRHVI